MIKPVQSLFHKLKTWGPTLGFLGGFFWDAITLGKNIQSLDLFLLLGYWLGAAILLYWMAHRPPNPEDPGEVDSLSTAKWKSILLWCRTESPHFILQFFFGGLFSALVIFYFKSAGNWTGYLLVFALATLMILNEIWDSHYHRFTLTWTLFGICGIFFLNFALPHLFKSIHPLWFYLSTLLGVACTWLLSRLSPNASGHFWPTPVLGGILIVLFLFKLIPPVPMVLKEIAIGHHLEKTLMGYSIEIEAPPWWKPLRRSEREVHVRGEPIYCLSSIFLPEGLTPKLYHRWVKWNTLHKNWETFSHIGFTVSGGRKAGFRGYSYKNALPEGLWQVRVESEDGRQLGVTQFEVVSGPMATDVEWKKILLQ